MWADDESSITKLNLEASSYFFFFLALQAGNTGIKDTGYRHKYTVVIPVFILLPVTGLEPGRLII